MVQMEKEKREHLKEFLLAGFVLVSIILILTLWTNNLLERETDGPGFYRATVQVDDGFYLTHAAEETSGTPLPTKEHKNEHGTPTPTFVPTTATPVSVQPTPTLETDQ